MSSEITSLKALRAKWKQVFISWAGGKSFLEECVLVSTGTELISSLVAGTMMYLIHYENQNKNVKNETRKEGIKSPPYVCLLIFF